MKNIYIFALSVFFFNFSFAAPSIMATTNGGAWHIENTWNLNRKPLSGDTIIVPAGKMIVITNQQALNNVCVKVFGTLRFTGAFSYLSLNNASSIQVYEGGKVETTIDFFQYIFIGYHTVHYFGDVEGPAIANGSTNGAFVDFNPLPVKFVGFSATKKNSDVLIQWSTAEETNADYYNIERSHDGTNWSTLAYVAALGNSTDLNSYSFTDRKITGKIIYYRIKQVDKNGEFTYTPVQVIKNESVLVSDIRISSMHGKVLLQFPSEIKGSLVVRFVSLSGQVVDQQTISQPVGQVVLNSKVTGNYIISVSNGQDVQTAKQVIL